MTSPVELLEVVCSEDDVYGYIVSTCFKTGPPGHVGLESEWFVHDRAERADPTRTVALARLQRVAAAGTALPGASWPWLRRRTPAPRTNRRPTMTSSVPLGARDRTALDRSLDHSIALIPIQRQHSDRDAVAALAHDVLGG